jgi:epoxyqueuosine reductase QueG
VDSGLGELGRMGILIHRIYGPCVRLSVVTTDLDLIPTGKTRLYIEEFCRFCKKCARNCPSKAISSGEEPNSRGAIHWSIEQEKCFSYWKRIGTDCGFCIRVCPYTKPNTFFHRLVRFYISRNSLNQRIALLLDDLLYGRQVPVPRDNPAQLVSTFP